MQTISIIIPCKNEQSTIGGLIDSLITSKIADEIIVVDDGSTDKTASILATKDVKVVRHPYSKGNGASIKSGTRSSTNDILIFLDADGQHNVDEIKTLISKMN